ncbi:type III-B CRISPR module RAMP protein Cmr1 [Thermodesulfobacterium thermophilum]|uniref:type III-B CRISPR module RAMP protein Cmr1 n=1 Tax=Thermodesulfobacterium thermophilum TaxID=886 RepID=UPI0003B31BC7|nr:type III-B CRISPR module RAMP protein Cmr1 [Thermodesulfobacterium thermophilum]
MKTVTLKIKTITPTFMGGGDGKFDEIRTSEIKGMLRWWFRALAGSFVGNDYKELKKYEGRFFGIADAKKSSQKSKFKLLITNSKLNFINRNTSGIPLNGYTYLGIGNVIFKWQKESRNFIPNPNKSGIQGNVLIDAGSTFDLEFFFYPGTTKEEINLITGSFYLATALGGFGLRARKCFGSWQIIKNEGLDLVFNPTDYTKEGIEKNIGHLKGILNKEFSNPTPATEYPAIDDSQFIFEVIQTNETDYKALLDNFGKHYRGFRVCAEKPKPGVPGTGIHTTDFDYLINANKPKNCDGLQNFRNYKVRNALFGLNIVYPNKKILRLERPKDNNEKEILRRASPIWFSVKEIYNKLNLHIVLFKSRFAPENSKVKFDNREAQVEEYTFLEQRFIPYIKKSLGG